MLAKHSFRLCLFYAAAHRLSALSCYCHVLITPPQGIEQMLLGGIRLETLSPSGSAQLLDDLDKGVDLLREPPPLY
ncbi:hypothetical protein [Streptomyces antarcticus]|uniref:hypothetical protein n=1 Tax=Streptomyces antarcticus TaxID=2996458 RepID=UPI002270BBC8|nr:MULTISPECIES: hypothetical protein [unclassified Streptomyces]MCY0940524.1 hypothetical protein [Streptomyces sp. H34-AA3]MCZ4082357.1 hypothetical protein [Streptomyces sp. H34-S5]